jgi:hypothetical protein
MAQLIDRRMGSPRILDDVAANESFDGVQPPVRLWSAAKTGLQGLCIHFIVTMSSQRPFDRVSCAGTGVDVPDSCASSLINMPISPSCPPFVVYQ